MHLIHPHPILQLDAFFDREAPGVMALTDTLGTRIEPGRSQAAAARLHAVSLGRAGFTVRSAGAGSPAATCAEAGHGGSVIALLAGGSPAGTRGGHLIGAAAHLAARAVQHHLQLHRLPGRIRFYVGQADAGGSDLAALARAGAFDDVDAALAWQPASHTGVIDQTTPATIQARFRFTGKAAPPAGSARDAMELMQVGITYLRKSLTRDACVDYRMADTDGLSSRAAAVRADVRYAVRSAHNDQATDLYRQVCDVARGAALMTGCALDIRFDASCSSLQHNGTLNQLLYEEMRRVEVAASCAVAREQITASYAQADDASTDSGRCLGAVLREPAPPVHDGIRTYDPLREDVLAGSASSASVSDLSHLADVSWATPTVQARVACHAFGTPLHIPYSVPDTSSAARAGVLRAARILTATALRLLQDPQALADAREELLERRGGRPYAGPVRTKPVSTAPARTAPANRGPVSTGPASTGSASTGQASKEPESETRIRTGPLHSNPKVAQGSAAGAPANVPRAAANDASPARRA